MASHKKLESPERAKSELETVIGRDAAETLRQAVRSYVGFEAKMAEKKGKWGDSKLTKAVNAAFKAVSAAEQKQEQGIDLLYADLVSKTKGWISEREEQKKDSKTDKRLHVVLALHENALQKLQEINQSRQLLAIKAEQERLQNAKNIEQNRKMENTIARAMPEGAAAGKAPAIFNNFAALHTFFAPPGHPVVTGAEVKEKKAEVSAGAPAAGPAPTTADNTAPPAGSPKKGSGFSG